MVKTTLETFTQQAKTIVSHHKHFTNFQKVLICSVIVGVVLCLCRNWWMTLIGATYTCALYGTYSLTQYLADRKQTVPSDQAVAVVEKVVDFTHALQTLLFVSPENANTDPQTSIQSATSVGKFNEIRAETHNNEANSNHEEELKLDIQSKVAAKVSFTPDPDPSKRLQYIERKPHSSTNEIDELSPEIDKLIKLILQDFVSSWVNLITKEGIVLHESELLLQHIFHGLHGRMYRINALKVINVIILMFRDHLHNIKQAQMMFKAQRKRRKSTSTTLGDGSSPLRSPVMYTSVEECFSAKFELHPAIRGPDTEACYLKSVIELLLIHLLREDLLESKSLFCALKELLMFNVLQSVLNLLCDSTFLHERIIKILSDEDVVVPIEILLPSAEIQPDHLEQKSTELKLSATELVNREEPLDENINTETENNSQANNDQDGKDMDSGSQVKWQEDTEVHTITTGICMECNRLCSQDKDRISPRPHSCSLGTTPIYYDRNMKDPDQLSLNSLMSFTSVMSTDSDTFHNASHERDTLDNDNDLQGDYIPEPSDNVFVPVADNEPNKVDPAFNPEPAAETKTEAVKANETKTEEQGDKPHIKESSPSFLNSKSQLFNLSPLPLPNPINSFPFGRKKQSVDRNRLSPSPTIEASHKEGDMKRCLSTGEISPITYDGVPCPSEIPSLFQDIRIIATETAKESGTIGSAYTLYILEFEALYTSEEGTVVHKSGTVKRRYSEFENLQTRLENNPQYKRSMRDVKGPKKLLPKLPFGNMGKDTVQSRKELLETFIVSLLKHRDICNGKELKQFLGYSGDGHLAFVRKVPENTAPRIDQRLVKTMSGVFDKIVEGLPSLPQSAKLPRIISPFDQSEQKLEEVRRQFEGVLKDTDAITLTFDPSDDQDTIESAVYQKFVDLRSFEILNEFDDNTTLGVSVLGWQDQSLGTSPRHMTNMAAGSQVTTLDISSHTCYTGHAKSQSNKVAQTESPFSDIVIDIITELLQGRGHWVCRENVIHTARIVIGRGLNRFLEGKLQSLVSKEMCAFYIRTLQDTVWPNGKLSNDLPTQYSTRQREEIKQQAIECLADFLPGILRTIVGDEDYMYAITELVDSMQYEELNRHFWYTVLDVLLEELFPEVSSQELQRKLSSDVHASS